MLLACATYLLVTIRNSAELLSIVLYSVREYSQKTKLFLPATTSQLIPPTYHLLPNPLPSPKTGPHYPVRTMTPYLSQLAPLHERWWRALEHRSIEQALCQSLPIHLLANCLLISHPMSHTHQQHQGAGTTTLSLEKKNEHIQTRCRCFLSFDTQSLLGPAVILFLSVFLSSTI